MEEKNYSKILINYIVDRKRSIFAYILFCAIFIVIFYLNDLPLMPISYAFLLFASLSIVFSIWDFIKYYTKHKKMCELRYSIINGLDGMPISQGLIEKDYENLLILLSEDKALTISKMDKQRVDMLDYYTLWTHQIKTPIAALRVLLQMESDKESRGLGIELFKIEEYVAMCLAYLKIDEQSTDLVLANNNLEKMVKQAVKKYANIFISKGVTIKLENLDRLILTDEKWLIFVIEQILSNALKYTVKGEIAIYTENGNVLVIEDTGIGIEAEDIPRVFDKGFTGYNGRMDKKATGIGLYVCKKVLNKLAHEVKIESELGVGTKVKIRIES